MPSVKINERTYDLKITWAAHEELKKHLGQDYTQALHSSLDDRNLEALALAVSCCVDELDAEAVYAASPAISPLWEAMTEAMLISFYGPSMKAEGGDSKKKLTDRLISFVTRRDQHSNAG